MRNLFFLSLLLMLHLGTDTRSATSLCLIGRFRFFSDRTCLYSQYCIVKAIVIFRYKGWADSRVRDHETSLSERSRTTWALKDMDPWLWRQKALCYRKSWLEFSAQIGLPYLRLQLFTATVKCEIPYIWRQSRTQSAYIYICELFEAFSVSRPYRVNWYDKWERIGKETIFTLSKY